MYHPYKYKIRLHYIYLYKLKKKKKKGSVQNINLSRILIEKLISFENIYVHADFRSSMPVAKKNNLTAHLRKNYDILFSLGN